MKKLLCFGDSNTWGYIPGGFGRFEENIRWTGRLNQALQSDGWTVIEEGLCGRTTIFEDLHRSNRNGSKILPDLLEKYQPDAVFIMLGTNDCKAHNKTDSVQITRGMQTLIEQVKEYNSELRRKGSLLEIPIVIASPILIHSGIHETDAEFEESAVLTSSQLPTHFRRLAYLFGAGFIAASDFVSTSTIDNEHMDATGHELFAVALYDYLCRSRTLEPAEFLIQQVS